MSVKLRKLDRRYKGLEHWSHRLELLVWHSERNIKVHEIRCMLTTNFGAGCHVDEAYDLQQNGVELPKWGFNNDGEFYVREEALVIMELSKGRWEK